ncbi:myeloid-associated differentiation marker-like protein 2 [Poeciliopsis prolifica]|uniref:myeloid-associated differentiation marker-like protein 2 n=1 Tax=Poeciliopsis prolifica TaxID=188132 RepID=UPI002414359A|nr:myeloid-associated differentiation marker-like protein 2 [Poeciliopsis prolifica]
MCGPFSSFQGIIRLVEMISSALALAVVLFRGRMVVPWGVCCEFVWVLCIVVPLVLLLVESRGWHILLAAFLPNWADLTLGLTAVCCICVVSATLAFAAVFVCLTCIANVLCFVFSLLATASFLVDVVKQKTAFGSGYMSSLRGTLRILEAFVGCMILTAAVDHFVRGEWFYKPFGMTLCAVIFGVCLLVTAAIIVLNLLKLLQCLLVFRLNLVELVFNMVAVMLYLLAVILWTVFGYRRYRHNPYTCTKCSYSDMNAVTAGSVLNLILYSVDLLLSIRSL